MSIGILINDSMTIRKYRAFIFCALLLTVLTAGAQSKKAHPYLYFTADHVQHLKERLKTDTLMARAWNDMKAKTDQAIAAGRGGNI